MSELINNGNELDNVEQSILKAFEESVAAYFKLPEDEQTGTWCTKDIKIRIGELGHKYGYDVRPSEQEGEWLYDLLWYKNDENQYLQEINLVLESELSDRNYHGIKYDLEKLFLSNAKYRIMLCMAKGNNYYPDNVNELIQNLNNNVAANKNLKQGDRILTLIWEDFTTGEIIPHLIVK